MEEPLISSPPFLSDETLETKTRCPNDTSIRRKPVILEVANGDFDDDNDEGHFREQASTYTRRDYYLLLFLFVLLLTSSIAFHWLASGVEIGGKEIMMMRFLTVAYFISVVITVYLGWQQGEFRLISANLTLTTIIVVVIGPLSPSDHFFYRASEILAMGFMLYLLWENRIQFWWWQTRTQNETEKRPSSYGRIFMI